MNTPQAKDIDQYIAGFPPEVQVMLEELRATIRNAAPEAMETISYQMPAFKLNGILVYFAAYKNHIGFYPTGSGIEHFKEEVSAYKSSKGTVQFPLNQPIPLDLITKIVKFRVKQNLEKAELKKAKIRKGKD
ncbi:MAG TPA: hypothetical protein DCL77_01960 [Prolixibacteraceae bacterium]|nr:hypothetical protein [Prolixibacteraceae bacterium]